MNNPSRSDELLENDLDSNDDSFMCGVAGIAGRDEPPNATTDWQYPLKNDEVMIRPSELESGWSMKTVERLDKVAENGFNG